jgi:hypothetical protein
MTHEEAVKEVSPEFFRAVEKMRLTELYQFENELARQEGEWQRAKSAGWPAEGQLDLIHRKMNVVNYVIVELCYNKRN